MSRRGGKVVDINGFLVTRASVVRALRQNPDCPYMRLALAFIDNKGVRLSVDHVWRLVECDHAVAAAIADIVKDDTPVDNTDSSDA